jgi:hypothetical protein
MVIGCVESPRIVFAVGFGRLLAGTVDDRLLSWAQSSATGKHGPSRDKPGLALVPFRCESVSIGHVAGPAVGEVGRKMRLMVCFTLIMVAREKYGI